MSNSCIVEPHISDDATPFVRITLAEPSQCMTPNTARELAKTLNEMAVSAEYEAGIIRSMQSSGVGIETIRTCIDRVRMIISQNRNRRN